jgi:hypothetical protein
MAGSSDSFRGKDIQLLTPIEDEMQKLWAEFNIIYDTVHQYKWYIFQIKREYDPVTDRKSFFIYNTMINIELVGREGVATNNQNDFIIGYCNSHTLN